MCYPSQQALLVPIPFKWLVKITLYKDIIRDQRNATRHNILTVENQEWSPSEHTLKPALSEHTPRSKQKDCGNLRQRSNEG